MKMDQWIPIVVAGVSLLGVIFVPIFTKRSGQKLSDQQYDELQRKAREDADAREERLRRRWQTTTDDVDYLWEFYQNSLVPWMRSAYEVIKTANPDTVFPQPPTLKPRPAKDFGDQVKDDDDV